MTEQQLLERLDLGWTAAIAERALRAMVREARRVAPLETGGYVFGRRTDMHYEIRLASGPGPHSTHELLTSDWNAKWLHRWWGRLHDKGVYWAGSWHTHPFQDEPLPSPGDMYGHPAYPDSDGWYGWLEKHQKTVGNGCFEVIMARRMTRLWYVGLAQKRAYLMAEVPVGLK